MQQQHKINAYGYKVLNESHTPVYSRLTREDRSMIGQLYEEKLALMAARAWIRRVHHSMRLFKSMNDLLINGQVVSVRKRLKAEELRHGKWIKGLSNANIAKKYNVPESTIMGVIRGSTR